MNLPTPDLRLQFTRRGETSDCSASGSMDREHLEADNVLGPIYKAFGEPLWPLMEELNLTLAA